MTIVLLHKVQYIIAVSLLWKYGDWTAASISSFAEVASDKTQVYVASVLQVTWSAENAYIAPTFMYI